MSGCYKGKNRAQNKPQEIMLQSCPAIFFSCKVLEKVPAQGFVLSAEVSQRYKEKPPTVH